MSETTNTTTTDANATSNTPLTNTSSTQPLVKGDMTVSDIIKKYPQAATVFTDYGLHCAGCHVSAFESIEDGARSHGMDDETIAMMLRDANTIATQTAAMPTDNNPVHITDAAIAKVKSLLKSGEENHYFRIGLTEGGCSGYSYIFSVDKTPKDDDVHFEKNGLKCVVKKDIFEMLKDATVDFVDTLQSSGFKVTNPNVKASCGCGNSFS